MRVHVNKRVGGNGRVFIPKGVRRRVWHVPLTGLGLAGLFRGVEPCPLMQEDGWRGTGLSLMEGYRILYKSC